jgi:hypothetical protein
MKMTGYLARPGRVTYVDNYEKGRLFEEYITRLFNKRHFTLDKCHESRRIVDHPIPVSFTYPDLELIFFIGRKQYRFAVECKWRQTFWDGKIQWAKPRQIRAYEDFQRRQCIPVFIAIGIGGQPHRPEKLFVTPLCNISHTTEVYESNLILYKRKPHHRFFYDAIQLNLF